MSRGLMLALLAIWTALWSAAIYIALPVIGAGGENRMSPVVTGSIVEAIQRDDSLACWRWSFVKQARRLGGHRLDAALVEADVKIDLPERDMVDTAALIKEPRGVLRYVRALKSSPGDGKRHHRVFCVDLERSEVTPQSGVEARQTMRYQTTLMLRWPSWWRDFVRDRLGVEIYETPLRAPWRAYVVVPPITIPPAR